MDTGDHRAIGGAKFINCQRGGIWLETAPPGRRRERGKEETQMDTIKIIWLDSDRKTRASFEMQAGDLEAASRIFAEMVKTLTKEKEKEP